MNRRGFIIRAAALAATPGASPDERLLLIEGREHALTDILAPTRHLFGADFFAAAFAEIIRHGALTGPASTRTDRWGRLEGAIGWRTKAGRETTLQEMLLAQGAARVAPESDDLAFIERCFAAEGAARGAGLGLWATRAWRIRDAAKAEWSRGFQIYAGIIQTAGERKNRVYFNFGDDFRTDFTATVAKNAFRRWKEIPDLASLAGRRAEIRGYVESINGPSVELLHEMQLRVF